MKFILKIQDKIIPYINMEFLPPELFINDDEGMGTYGAGKEYVNITIMKDTYELPYYLINSLLYVIKNFTSKRKQKAKLHFIKTYNISLKEINAVKNKESRPLIKGKFLKINNIKYQIESICERWTYLDEILTIKCFK